MLSAFVRELDIATVDRNFAVSPQPALLGWMSEIPNKLLGAAVDDFFQFLQCQLRMEAGTNS